MFHAKVVSSGYENVCIKQRYDVSRHLYLLAEQREQRRVRLSEKHIHEQPPGQEFEYKPSYGTRNEREWFARLSEAMFAISSEQPFNRNDFWRMDPESFMVVWNAWHDPEGFCPAQP